MLMFVERREEVYLKREDVHLKLGRLYQLDMRRTVGSVKREK